MSNFLNSKKSEPDFLAERGASYYRVGTTVVWSLACFMASSSFVGLYSVVHQGPMVLVLLAGMGGFMRFEFFVLRGFQLLSACLS